MSTRLQKEKGWVHLSAGDLLRAEVAKKTPTGTQLAALMKDGKIVPSEITVGLLKVHRQTPCLSVSMFALN